jgi:predicted acetyltransferase
VLWASDERIYGRYGYGIASLSAEIDLPRVRAALVESAEPVGHARLVSHDEARAAFPDVYERVAAETPGMYARSEDWWDVRILADPPERRFGGGDLVRVLAEIDGRPEGYALYRVHQSFERGFSIGFARVLEAMGTSADATREVWRVPLGIDWVDRISASLLPIDHPLLFLAAEPRRMGMRVGDGIWLRLVDVGTALTARSFRDGATVVLDVQDDFCAWNAGRWKVGDGQVERSDEEPDVRCDVSVLGSVFLGGFTFLQLAAAGRVHELQPGGLARADARFRTDRAPWCPEIF